LLFDGEGVEQAHRLRDPTHVRSYTEDEWRALLGANGFEVEQSTVLGGRRLALEPWLDRVEVPAEERPRIRELLGDASDGEAVAETGANTTMVFVPARFATDAIYEAIDAGIGTVICIAEGLPAHEMLGVYNYIRTRGVTMLGPNCPGALSPGKANVGIIPAEIFREGGIGLVSRSGTLTYQIGHELTQLGLGNST